MEFETHALSLCNKKFEQWSSLNFTFDQNKAWIVVYSVILKIMWNSVIAV